MQGRSDCMQRFAQQDATAKPHQNFSRVTPKSLQNRAKSSQNRFKIGPKSIGNGHRSALGWLLDGSWKQLRSEIKILLILELSGGILGSSWGCFGGLLEGSWSVLGLKKGAFVSSWGASGHLRSALGVLQIAKLRFSRICYPSHAKSTILGS